VITGAHVILYSTDADADRVFLRDVLDFPHVDAGGGWLIFRLPPAEVAVHPADAPAAELYLMCDALEPTLAELRGRGVEFAEVQDAGWGRVTTFTLPGGATVGLYEPRHPLPPE
jgi:catechol 2,3-dioxygenase-like lactoylglutathione lyase family enzyme